MSKPVKMSFDSQAVSVPLPSILPMKHLRAALKASQKYQQVLASVREVGIIEPLIVFPQADKSGTYLLLDGHLRLEVLKQLGEAYATCLIATDDEAYTYNKRVSRMATIQEHMMLLKAINNGVNEDRIAKTLAVDIARIRQQRQLLQGICHEAAEILKTRYLSPNVFGVMKKMKPMRQIEVAELLVAANNFSVPYTKALLAATPSDMLVDPDKHKTVGALTPEQMGKMEKEMEVLQRDLKAIEDSHGNEVLNLVLARGYMEKLFANARVTRYLGQHHSDIYRELQAIVEGVSLES